MRTGVGTYILIILVILILFGLVSIGDILSVAFYIVMGFIALVLIGILIFRYRMNRLRRQMEEQGETFRTYTWGGGRNQKKKDGEMSIELDRTQDILKYLGEHRREGQFYCGFSMETEHMLENSRKKLTKKNLDMIVANNVKDAGAGFQGNTNVITMITQDSVTQLPLMDKEEAAHAILTEILARR